MKRLLLPLLAALALPNAVNANVDPAVHNLCKDVSDYMGCVKANSKKEISIFEGLSKKETEFLKDHINSPRRVSTSNGKWILLGIKERSGDEIYVDIIDGYPKKKYDIIIIIGIRSIVKRGLDPEKILPFCNKLIDMGDNAMDPRKNFEDLYFYFVPSKTKSVEIYANFARLDNPRDITFTDASM